MNRSWECDPPNVFALSVISHGVSRKEEWSLVALYHYTDMYALYHYTEMYALNHYIEMYASFVLSCAFVV